MGMLRSGMICRIAAKPQPAPVGRHLPSLCCAQYWTSCSMASARMRTSPAHRVYHSSSESLLSGRLGLRVPIACPITSSCLGSHDVELTIVIVRCVVFHVIHIADEVTAKRPNFQP